VLNKACTELADASFPGDTPPQTMQAWDHKDHGYGRNHLKPCGLFTSLRDGNRPHRIVGQPLVTANDVGH